MPQQQSAQKVKTKPKHPKYAESHLRKNIVFQTTKIYNLRTKIVQNRKYQNKNKEKIKKKKTLVYFFIRKH